MHRRGISNDGRVSQMTLRCRFSEYGKRVLRPRHPERLGTYLGEVRRRFGPPCVRVKWDGLKIDYTFAKDFIEVLKPADICMVDLSRAPILAELLGITSKNGHQPINRKVASGNHRPR